MMQPINPYAATLQTDAVLLNPSGLATRSQRFIAALIDWAIQMVIIFPVSFMLGMFLAMQMKPGITLQVVANFAGGTFGLVVFLALNGYFLARQGKTIGKLAMGITIVDRDSGQLVPFIRLLTRRYLWLWIIAMIPILNWFIPVIDVLLIFRANRACLHDDIANTKVIVDVVS